MPRKLDQSMTLDTLEDECRFTSAALKADEHAAELAGRAAGWIEEIDKVRALNREVMNLKAENDAQRIVANTRLDLTVVLFSDDKLRAVSKDRADPEWTYYFPRSPSVMVRERLVDQVTRVKGWLTRTDDPQLDAYKERLQKYVGVCEACLVAEQTVAARRSALWSERRALAAKLTDERDALHGELASLSRARKLGRTWADAFFRKKATSSAKESPPAPSDEG